MNENCTQDSLKVIMLLNKEQHKKTIKMYNMICLLAIIPYIVMITYINFELREEISIFEVLVQTETK